MLNRWTKQAVFVFQAFFCVISFRANGARSTRKRTLLPWLMKWIALKWRWSRKRLSCRWVGNRLSECENFNLQDRQENHNPFRSLITVQWILQHKAGTGDWLETVQFLFLLRGEPSKWGFYSKGKRKSIFSWPYLWISQLSKTLLVLKMSRHRLIPEENTYLLLTEFEVRTVSYRPSFFPAKRAGHKS